MNILVIYTRAHVRVCVGVCGCMSVCVWGGGGTSVWVWVREREREKKEEKKLVALRGIFGKQSPRLEKIEKQRPER